MTDIPTGWICPVCHRGNAPHVAKCGHCADHMLAEQFLGHRQLRLSEVGIIFDYVFRRLSLREISDDTGMAIETVRQRLRECGVTLRSQGDRYA